jgi:hypothetical protein
MRKQIYLRAKQSIKPKKHNQNKILQFLKRNIKGQKKLKKKKNPRFHDE